MTPSNLNGTLASELFGFPYIFKQDMSNVPCASVAKAIVNAQQSPETMFQAMAGKVPLQAKPLASPESSALEFYLLNHAVSVVRSQVHELEQLGPLLPVVVEYKRSLAAQAARMFYYLILICTRESRHDARDYGSSTYKKHVDDFGSAVTDFHKSVKGKGSDGAANQFRVSPPEAGIGPYSRFLSDVFYQGSYSGGFGGKAWGGIADVLRDFVTGSLSAEMMLDTAFTLAHNNGPIFNKGMLYSYYGNAIYRILDVQRSGQIPQLIASEANLEGSDARVKALHAMCRKAFEDAGLKESLEGPVDWYQVEALGSVKKYPDEKKAQDAKNGITTPMPNKAYAQPQAKKPTEAQSSKFIKYVEVYPGSKIMKVKR